MKRILIIIISLIISVNSYSQLLISHGPLGGGEPSSLLDGLQAYWAFEETTGLVLYDETINDYDGDHTNTPTLEATGIVGNCYSFSDVSSEWVDHGADVFWDPNLDDMTISVWIQTNSSSDDMAVSGTWGTGYFWHITVRSSNLVRGTVYFGSNIETNSNSGISTSTWYHIIYQLDRDGNASLYINNTLQTDTDDISSHSATNLANASTYATAQIGNTLGGWYFNGLIDEFGVWNRLLTSAERAGLYNSGNGITYPLDF